ncbi:MAG TPA: hypothetical protein VLE89_08680 [Chlamydiales bacterium]|nr:hypothetical protein [Chlamydiales bacterium]
MLSAIGEAYGRHMIGPIVSAASGIYRWAVNPVRVCSYWIWCDSIPPLSWRWAVYYLQNGAAPFLWTGICLPIAVYGLSQWVNKPSLEFLNDEKGNVKTCPICMGDLDKKVIGETETPMSQEEIRGGAVVRHTAAEGEKHLYHRECLTFWLAREKTCPDCRREIRSIRSPFSLKERVVQALFKKGESKVGFCLWASSVVGVEEAGRLGLALNILGLTRTVLEEGAKGLGLKK